MRIELGAPRLALTARRPLTARTRPAYPHNRRGDPDLELGRRPPGRHPAERRIDHTITQILAVSPRHGRPPSPKKQRTRTVRAIWESLQESKKPESALERGLLERQTDIRRRIRRKLDLAQHRVAFRADLGLSPVDRAPVLSDVSKPHSGELHGERRTRL